MNEDLKGRALRAAAAVLAEVGPLDSHEQTVAAVAAAFAEGYGAGLADALAVSEGTVRLAARAEVTE